MTQINCHIPIKLRIVGELSDAQLKALAVALRRDVQARLAFAEQTVAAHYNLPALAGKAEVREAFDPAREEDGRYEIPAFDRQGLPVSMRLGEPPRKAGRPWTVRRAIYFKASVGNFFELVESFAPGRKFEGRELYLDLFEEQRWVSLWLVRVNHDVWLAELEETIMERFDQLSRRRPNENLFYLIGATEQVRRKLMALDQKGQVAREIPPLHTNRLRGAGADLVVPAGGLVLFAGMPLPRVDENDVLAYDPEVVVSLPLHALDFIVDPESFEHLFPYFNSWDDFISQYGDQPAHLHILPFTTLQRVQFDRLKYMVEAVVAVGIEKDSAYFGNLYLLNNRRIRWLPPAARQQARALTDDATLALNESRRTGVWEPGWRGAFIYAVINPFAQPNLNDPQPDAAKAKQLEPAESPRKLISRFTSWGNLDEEGLGTFLVSLVRKSPALSAYVMRVLDELGYMNRDDVSLAFAENATDADLESLARSHNGRLLLVRLYDELTSENYGEEEQKQAARLLAARVSARSIELVAKRLAKSRGYIFPWRKSGPTVWDDAPIMAKRLADGRIHVEIPVRVGGTDMFRAEVATLPRSVFTSGLILDADEWISVKLYDEGGIIVRKPAIYLLEVSNVGARHTGMKVLEVTGLALGGLGGAAVRGSRVLLFLDRAAVVIGVLGMLVDDHRGWIIKTFGEAGRTFVQAVGVAQALTGVYGLGRVAVSLPKVTRDLRSAWRNWRSSPAFKDLSADELRRAEEISQKTGQFLDDMDAAAAEIRKDAAAAGSPPPGPAGGAMDTPDDASGLGILGKPAPPPSGPISADLKQAFLKQLESRWFRTKLRAYAKLTGKGEVDWNELSRMVESAEFREYATAWEAAQSIGYAGKSGDKLVLGMSKKMRKIPILGNSAMQHEIVHVYQEMVGQVLTKEASKSLPYPKLLKAEVAAQVFGSPAVILTYVGGMTVVIVAGYVYIVAD